MANSKSKGGRATPKKQRSTASEWKKSAGVIDLELPSGKVVGVRRPQGMTGFMSGGNIPNSLLPLLTDAMDGKAPSESALVSILEDPSQLADLMNMVDSMVITCVVDPPVSLPPEKEEDRSDDVVYTDEMADDDKMFIMQFSMSGAKDLKSFRGEQAATMDAMADVQRVQDPTVSAPSD